MTPTNHGLCVCTGISVSALVYLAQPAAQQQTPGAQLAAEGRSSALALTLRIVVVMAVPIIAFALLLWLAGRGRSAVAGLEFTE